MSQASAPATAATPADQPECAICFSNFNKTTRKQVSCQFCATSICRGCAQQHLLHQGITHTCPSVECRLPWSDEFLDQNMTAAFRHGALAEHKKKYLLDREKARLPEFQERARLYMTIQGKYNEIAKECDAAYKEYDETPLIIELKKVTKEVEAEMSILRQKKIAIIHGARMAIYPEINSAYYNGLFDSFGRNPDRIAAARAGLKDDAGRQLFDDMLAISDNTYNCQNRLITFNQENSKELLVLDKEIELVKDRHYISDTIKRHVLDRFGRPCEYDELRVRREEEDDDDDDFHDDEDNEPNLGLVVSLVERLGEGCVSFPNQGNVRAAKQIVVHCGCPVEDCKGFIGAGWNCGLCDVKVCQTCRESVAASVAGTDAEAEHVCDPTKVETVKVLAKETKPCPTCAALIYKTDGCDQMWCTQCQTTFSWRTGQKEEGRIHNPHYYEWLRRTLGPEGVPREPGDGGGCGENDLRPFNMMGALLNRPVKRCLIAKRAYFADVDPLYHVEAVGLVDDFHRLLVEVRHYHYNARELQNNRNKLAAGLEDYAVCHLAGEVSEEEWPSQILKVETDLAFQQALFQVYEMFYNAGKDIYNSISEEAPIGQALKQFVGLHSFASEELVKVNKRFGKATGGVVLRIYPSFLFQQIVTTSTLLRRSGLTGRVLEAYVAHITVPTA